MDRDDSQVGSVLAGALRWRALAIAGSACCVIGPSASGRNRLEDKGKVKVTLDADTVYGDSHHQVLKVKTKS